MTCGHTGTEAVPDLIKWLAPPLSGHQHVPELQVPKVADTDLDRYLQLYSASFQSWDT